MTTYGLDLSSAHIKAWHAMLPDDFKAVLASEASPALDESLAPLVTQFATANEDRYLDLIEEHDAVLSAPEFGQGRRVRLMAWILRVCWPRTTTAIALLSSGKAAAAGEADEGDGSAGGGRKLKGSFPILFLQDHQAIESIVRPRIARSVSDTDTVEALANGLRSFERSGDGPTGVF